MDKKTLLSQVLGRLEQQLATMQHAARSSHDAATGSESKSEGKYDTRGLEASYLAGAQIEQCEKIAQAIRILQTFVLPETDPDASAQAGHIVEVESNGDIQHYFLLPCAGGITLEHDDGEFITLTPDAPLYQAVLGKKAGELVEEKNSLILEIL